MRVQTKHVARFLPTFVQCSSVLNYLTRDALSLLVVTLQTTPLGGPNEV
jgi:hypothetical protein